MAWERVNPINLNLNTSGLRSFKTSGLAGYNPLFSGSMAIDPVSAAIAGASVIGNLIGGFESKKMQKRALAQQQKQFEEQMAFNNDWNIINYKNENRWRQFDYNWNTMKAQRQRIEDAGMNPALMMGQMSPGFSSSQAAGTGSFGAPNAQTPIVTDALGQSFSRLAGDVGSVLQSFASAGKMDMETKEIRDTLYQKVRGQMLENDQRELALTLDRMYAVTERYQGIRQQVADYAKTVAEKVAAYAQGRYFDESALNQMEQSMLNAAKRKMSEEEYRQFVELFPIVKQREQEAVRLLQQQQKTEESKQASNYASASLSRQMTETEKENTRKAHWDRIAASWNALDSKTSAILNKKYGSAERVQSLISSEVDNFVKSHKAANPTDIYNFGQKLYDNLLDKIGLGNYNGIDRTAVGRNLQQAIEDELRIRYDIYD